MNPRVFVACVASFASAAAVLGQTGDTQHEVRIDLDHLPASSSAPSKPAASTPAPRSPSKSASPVMAAKPATAAPATDDSADAKPKIDGQVVPRGERGYLGVKIEDNTWKISFYDQDKKPKDVDVAAIVLRWPVQYQRNEERTELLPSADGKAMVSSKTVRPPFAFKLFITLLKDTTPGADLSPETYVIDFHQDAPDGDSN